jgi:hypothetical protein
MNITNNLTVSDSMTEQLSYGAFAQVIPGGETPTWSWANGTGANLVDEHFEQSYTLASGASVTLTLSALVDGLGRTAAFARVRKYYINMTTYVDGDYLTLGGAATNAWAANPIAACYDFMLAVYPGVAGYVVASGSSDQLKITNSGANPITFLIAFAGASV